MRFEIPAEITKSLTDAGHTAVGFATLAAKRANDARLDANARFETQVVEARERALTLVESLETARVRVETTVEPMVDRALERLPDNVQETLGEYRRVRKDLADRAHSGAVKAIEFATAVPVAMSTTARTAPKAAAAKLASAKRGPKAASTPKAATKSAPKAATKAAPKAATKRASAAKATRRPRTTAAA